MKALQIKQEMIQDGTPVAIAAIASLMVERAIKLVFEEGGFLGANSTHYAFGVRDDSGKVLVSGWRFDQEAIERAWEFVGNHVPGMLAKSQENFTNLSNSD